MMLPGIVVKPLKRFADERGFFTEIMRTDWRDVIQDDIVQANMSVSYPGMVRAWHRHERGQVDHFLVIRGALKICAYDDESSELDEVISAGENPQLVRIPGHYWHGFKVVGNEQATLIYFVNRLYDYSSPDEERRPWDDQTIIPETINGKRDDRCGKAWDWFLPAFK
ncbi:MAG TPA: dTDP-4-dehydrorhamnose 3,5-epimerase family protein [Methanothrix sp.]|jgi:dTDP-4-dehydrorhamnose 3,5-epimerase|nr:dTDP-4-dehydrorhamnose 3,5-epimerase family protein [Methanothrix sp.]HON36688.1 dTDP-4-dehydrorhamnose 3,5-epimerase family protein [Methanothrix sp.]HRU75913.1 dTDP-4-dehydrorhamnose 3,5-epimerase family protein [Methanothrix sp.]